MSDVDGNTITNAATAVMRALEPLSPEERARVIQSAAALYGIGLPSPVARNSPSDPDDEGGTDADVEEQWSTGKQLSIVEFLRQKDPATNAQRIATFAYYREHVEKKSRFSRADLEHYFAKAKLAKPANYDRDFTAAVREGWIHEDAGDSYLTQHGEETVRAGFEGKAKPRGAAVAKRKPGNRS